MNTNMSQYETVSSLSTRMLEAARANDWDQLCELEHEVTTLMSQVKATDADAQQNAAINERMRQHKIELIRKILAEDREIRSHTDPWMESVRTMLSSGAKQRAVNNAYGV